MPDLKLPSWELAKEIADMLPGGKGGVGRGGKPDDPKCENCGEPINDKKGRKGV